VRIAVSNMTRAIRSVSIERGKDPRDFDLIAFGGTPFAAAVARELSLKKLLPAGGRIFPLSDFYSDLEHHFTQPCWVKSIFSILVSSQLGGLASKRKLPRYFVVRVCA
jgi:N-methylhydantoinase A/oxoprolinase/acetone carboxylase beta subunit